MSKPRDLTPQQIEAIGNLLHQHVQFFDGTGQCANHAKITEIERVLSAHSLSEV